MKGMPDTDLHSKECYLEEEQLGTLE
jgi:hypothetical protein